MSHTVTCIDCGTTNTLKNAPQGEGVYRCRSCAARKRWERDRKYPETLTCQNCGEDFEFKMSGGEVNKYCCQGCYIEDATGGTVTKTCPVCEEDFTVSASTADRYTRCSAECRDSRYETSKCERCGKEFHHGSREDRRHCSEKCRRPPHIVDCRNCGDRFRITPSRKESDRRGFFCSFRCYRSYQGETQIEKITRRALETIGLSFVQEYPIERVNGRDFLFDFYIPSGSLLIEADGVYWHSDALNRDTDLRKTSHAESLGYSVERIRGDTIRETNWQIWLFPLLQKHCVPLPNSSGLLPQQLCMTFQ